MHAAKLSGGILLSDSVNVGHAEDPQNELAKYHANCTFRSPQRYHPGISTTDLQKASLKPFFAASQAASLRSNLLAELNTSSLTGGSVGGPRFYVPFVVAKIAAHQWLQLVTRAGTTAARWELLELGRIRDDWASLVGRAGYMRDFLQIIISNMCDISEYLSRDFERYRPQKRCTGDYTSECCNKLLRSVMGDYEMVSKTAERAIDRMDKHTAILGSVASVQESRKSIQLSKKVGYVSKPLDHLGFRSCNQS